MGDGKNQHQDQNQEVEIVLVGFMENQVTQRKIVGITKKYKTR
jgi:pyridoxal/pyridoxine/pyridoxamine kinase